MIDTRLVVGLAVAVFIALVAFECGPEVLCIAQGGEPVGNAFIEWCDMDGDGSLSEPDFRLEW